MDIAIFGLGYVGAVSAACLAGEGHNVVGIDSNAGKAELINHGQSPVVEKDLAGMIAQAVAAGRLRATTDPRAAIRDSELAMVCVGTPSRGNGDLDLTYVRRVCEEIAEALRHKRAFTAVVIRSTVLPGTLRNLVIPTLESGIRQEGRARFRRRPVPGVSAGEHGGPRLLQSAEGRDRGERSPDARHARSP